MIYIIIIYLYSHQCSHKTTQKQSIQSIHTVIQTIKLQNKSTTGNQGKIKSDGKKASTKFIV